MMMTVPKTIPLFGRPASQPREVALQGGQVGGSKQVRIPVSIRMVLSAAVIMPMLMTAAAGWLGWLIAVRAEVERNAAGPY